MALSGEKGDGTQTLETGGTNETSQVDEARVEEARASCSRIIHTTLCELKAGKYSVDVGYKPEKRGNLGVRSAQDLVGIVDEIGMENFEADGSTGFPIFTYVDKERGICCRVRIQGEESKHGVSGEEHLFIDVSSDPTAEPVITMDLKHGWYYRDDRFTVTYSSRMPTESGSEIVREIRLKRG